MRGTGSCTRVGILRRWQLGHGLSQSRTMEAGASLIVTNEILGVCVFTIQGLRFLTDLQIFH